MYQNVYVKVSLDVTKREVHPGDWMKVHVQTTSDACVCVGAVDRSAVLMHPGYQLSIDEVMRPFSYCLKKVML